MSRTPSGRHERCGWKEALNDFLEPLRTNRRQYEAEPGEVIEALRKGTSRANEVAEETLALAKRAMRQDFFGRVLSSGG
ncbi:hypothetical protein [Streptomyces sp. CB03238]|uniref:hypothetical protein n=1 Tax=Streptomyces sp. CB03238 TaxID=1907777 RepID=UPI000A11BB44|nr:hypothetical protein [Streptomyces sp. CB03238]ORT60406.1 hypothetical protein BKD26_08475 [Streptomyces sp. CB03238]